VLVLSVMVVDVSMVVVRVEVEEEVMVPLIPLQGTLVEMDVIVLVVVTVRIVGTIVVTVATISMTVLVYVLATVVVPASDISWIMPAHGEEYSYSTPCMANSGQGGRPVQPEELGLRKDAPVCAPPRLHAVRGQGCFC
jgi:hypothetical protein